MLLTLIALSAFGTFLTIANSLTMRVVTPQTDSAISQSVSLLVPMRNEEKNVEALVASIQRSQGMGNWDFTVLNDSSTDRTAEILSASSGTVINGAPLPKGWLGKNWACQQLAEGSKGEYLVFVDADVRLHPCAVSSGIAAMNRWGWDFISPYPQQIALTFFERIFQPLLQWSWLASVPLRLAERLRISSMTIANGQFFIVKRAAYLAVGGHEAIRHEVLDDLRLARTLVDGGFKGGVAEGSAVARTRMYSSARELIDGYSKSLWTAFGGFIGTLITVLLLIATQILPLALGIAGVSAGWIAYFITAASHGIAAVRTRSSMANIFLHPLSTILLILLIGESIRRKATGKLVWRERYFG